MDGDSHPLSFHDGAAAGPSAFQLEGWTVVPQAHELVRPGETVHVEPRPMEVLVHLAARAGEAVSREDLMEAVWPDVFVTEHALNRCVSQLRKLFDDDPRTPRVIETIPKMGYRLIAPVAWLPGDSAAAPLDALDLRVTPSAGPAAEARRARPVFAAAVLLFLLGALVALALMGRRSAPAPTTRPLTTAPGLETNAAWSPDGTRLAYVHRREEGAEGLYARALGSDAVLRLTDGPADLSPAWFPDGSRLAFVRCGEAQCDLYTVSALGGAVRRLAEGPFGAYGLDVAPNGRTFAISAPRDTVRALGVVLVDAETGARQRLTEPPEGAADVAPRFSPDGEWIVFLRRNAAGGDLYRIPATGGAVERLTADHRPIAGHAWAADGRSLLFSSARTGVYALWRISAEGGTPAPVAGPAVRDPGGPVVARVGQRLAVEDWSFEINLWELSAGGEPVRRVASTLWDKQPHLSADGARLAFISNRSGFTEVWTAARDGSGLLRVTDFGGASVEHPRWSPDGEHLVFQVRTEVQADLYVVATAGGTPRLLTSHPADDVAPRWSRDGQYVYFGSNRSGTWQVWRHPVEGGAAEQVTQGGGYTAEEAADGTLLVARYDAPGLWRVTDGVATRLADLPALGDWGTWAVTARGVVVLERERAAQRLRLLDPATGAVGPLPFAVRDLVEQEPSLTATADGRTIVAAQVDRVEADLLLVEPFD